MYRRLLAAALFVAAATAPAFASLSPGTTAPDFKTQASMGGKVFAFNLADALKKGPVVLYFYPAAFTKGCTIEAHDFAAAIGQYKKLGATVIGVSHDKIATLNKFSVSECRSKFPVAADPTLTVAKAYDAVLPEDTSYANRTSYVIAPNGKIIYAYTNMEPDQHVANTLNALRKYRASETTHK
ncbi:MAG TPA: peroxiredoxin [Candidatus Baltobacteraceae bacterium]|jgi:peroxiredoxin|nr:peroxiredoxin [Candidatus Baltobacteraceae bacterium]